MIIDCRQRPSRLLRNCREAPEGSRYPEAHAAFVCHRSLRKEPHDADQCACRSARPSLDLLSEAVFCRTTCLPKLLRDWLFHPVPPPNRPCEKSVGSEVRQGKWLA